MSSTRRLLTLLPQLGRAGALRASEHASATGSLLFTRGFADDANLKKTVLYDFHVANGGKMVPFAGWSMPIQYKDSIMESTIFCRKNASLFDVSHMCGLTLKGKDAIKFLEGLVVGDIAGLKDGTGSLSVFTNEQGGIIDDTVITKVNGQEIYVVVNAGCRDKDLAHLDKHLQAAKSKGLDVALTVHDDRSLLALQGPAAKDVLGALAPGVDLAAMYFSDFRTFDVAGIPCWVTRTGYTGEDGFEISVPSTHAVALAEKLTASERVRLAGLGPRDSLRLEAGLCLYGNDLNESLTPVEAGLAWTIGKRRREGFDFLGGDVIKKQLAEGVSKRRVGFVSSGAPARQHSVISTPDGQVVGEVTSGAFSPCLKKNIAMGYVEKDFSKPGTQLKVEVRGKQNEAVVTKMPFLPTPYYKRPEAAKK
ncbi:hypothetical protein VOLCADRAFT_107582 [Volvox carteri f. nagariensis]|uniref:Aminomethyltransferase n=1 Tax=Volvox carteri f. nagariensis TaxID=3068 RepID=D8UF24_VOLCA|nr:uncharacterized protein VOLCADRAFT_107582 [Volvox carteri f. nagariensis]EFJ41696.1 hypothetical protein VOLCADRAFT_107582 [Volvox carteri f. nagariensis]|eukprot:XP_002957198.1 hypothetical protein VOLCADRAFT_107582 [Volvox carteri f. nagariensis]